MVCSMWKSTLRKLPSALGPLSVLTMPCIISILPGYGLTLSISATAREFHWKNHGSFLDIT